MINRSFVAVACQMLLLINFASISARADYVVKYEQQTSSNMAAEMLASIRKQQPNQLAAKLKDPAFALVFGQKVSTTMSFKGTLQRQDVGSMHHIWNSANGDTILIDDSKRSYLELSGKQLTQMRTIGADRSEIAWQKHAVITRMTEERTIAGHPAIGYHVAVPGITDHTIDIWLSKDISVQDSSIPFDMDIPKANEILGPGIVLSLTTYDKSDADTSTTTKVATSVVEKPVPQSVFRIPKGYKSESADGQIERAKQEREAAEEIEGQKLVEASEAGDVDELSKLAADGADMNQDEDGFTPLVCAIVKNRTETVKFLLQHGANPNSKSTNPEPDSDDEREISPLEAAIDMKNASIVSDLLDHGADPNRRIIENSTPLIIASGQGLTDIVKALLDHHANPLLKDDLGDDAISSARDGGHSDIVEMIQASIKRR